MVIAVFRSMQIFSKDRAPSRDLVPSNAVSDVDREEMRGWIQTLRKEAGALRAQAKHMNSVAADAEALADRIENVLRGT